MPLKHLLFTSIVDENRFYRDNPGVHLVKAIISGSDTHIWIADNKNFYHGGHMQTSKGANR